MKMDKFSENAIADFFDKWSGAYKEDEVPNRETAKGRQFFEDAQALHDLLWMHGGRDALESAILYTGGTFLPKGLSIAWEKSLSKK